MTDIEIPDELIAPLYIKINDSDIRVNLFDLFGEVSIDILNEPKSRKRARFYYMRKGASDNERRKVPIICDCGARIHKNSLSNHRRSSKHILKMLTKAKH